MIVDDHRILREGLVELMSSERDMVVVAEASDGYEAIDMVDEAQPDVIVMDLTMPRMGGLEATRRVHAKWPDIRIVALSMHGEEEMAKAMLNAGASAYLTKGGPVSELIRAIRHIV